MLKLPKITSLKYLCNISRKTWRMKLQINIKGFFNWHYHFRCVWTEIPKITSLSFLYNILRKKWMLKLIFCIHTSIKVSCILIEWFLIEVEKHSPTSQNNKFAILYNISKNKWDMKLYLPCRKTSKFPTSWFQDFVHRTFPTRWYYRYWWEVITIQVIIIMHFSQGMLHIQLLHLFYFVYC